MTPPRLSICIATYSRGAFIGETLENILAQWEPGVEVIVVDGASPDDTADVVARVQARHPALVLYREAVNSGVDADFDKAVGYAQGEYCWLLSDDDMLRPGAVRTVLAALEDGPDLVVVNAEVRDKELAAIVKPDLLRIGSDRTFAAGEHEALFAATCDYLSFIGGVVVRRATWLARDRRSYYGTLFIHIGTLFQAPALGRAKAIARPLVSIRYGNAMWSGRAFEIWVAKWPRLVWSFAQFAEATRAKVIARHPGRSLQTLVWYRALGVYGAAEFEKVFGEGGEPHHPLAALVARAPARLLNAAIALWCALRRPPGRAMMLFELSRAASASAIARRLYAGLSAARRTP
ncbi:glycosyltransferase family 2 protein [Ramlibacter sp.]|uniref:glycosyltransferase family 2 protein n=1 Tax=Ramlibacter sp. TaxID=1917967 RepID=UPI003D107A6B